MAQTPFYVTGQVISFFSLLIMIAVIVFSLNQRKQAGYPLPPWVIQIYIFLALDGLVGLFLTGFQQTDSILFYAGRRLFSLFSILFIFLTLFDFPTGKSDERFTRERRVVILYMGAQMLFNAGGLLFYFFTPERAEQHAWLDVLRNLLMPLNFIWIALLAMRRGRMLLAIGVVAIGKTLTRFSWFFWLGVLLSVFIALRDWLPFAFQMHVTASSYGWMILCAGTALVFLSFGGEKPLQSTNIILMVVLVLLLALGLVAELFSRNLGIAATPKEIDRFFRPFIFVQVGILLLVFLALPRWLKTIFPENPSIAHTLDLIKPLTPRQQEVLRLLAKGYSNPQIATTLHVTEPTVKYHVSKLMVEQNKRSRRELMELAQKLIRDGML